MRCFEGGLAQDLSWLLLLQKYQNVPFFCFLPLVAVRQRSYDMVLSLVMGGAFVEQVCLTKWTATHEAAKVDQADSRRSQRSLS